MFCGAKEKNSPWHRGDPVRSRRIRRAFIGMGAGAGHAAVVPGFLRLSRVIFFAWCAEKRAYYIAGAIPAW